LCTWLWLYEGYTQPHAKERVLPTGEMQIVINLLEDRTCIYDGDDTDRCQTFRGSVLSGAHSEYQVITTAMQASVIGVAFKPGGAFRSSGCLPAKGCLQANCATHRVPRNAMGRRRGDSARSIARSGHASERFQILECAMLSELARGFDRHRAVDFALGRLWISRMFATVAEVTDEIGLNPKRFIQVFRDQLDSHPRYFAVFADSSSAQPHCGRQNRGLG